MWIGRWITGSWLRGVKRITRSWPATSIVTTSTFFIRASTGEATRRDTPRRSSRWCPGSGRFSTASSGTTKHCCSSIAAILGLLLFLRLCRATLPPSGALFAAAAFAVNPLLIYLATSMQPESLMLLLSLLAMTLIWSWDDNPRFVTLVGAAVTTAAAILAKSPAACLAPVLASVVIRKLGTKAFTDVRIYAAGLVVIVPPLMWYLWAWRFWHLYGNSLGVSNESHFIGWDMLARPRFLRGILKWETIRVFTPAGWLLALAGLSTLSGRARLALIWYGAVWLFYIVSARTSGDDWSFYYHSISVAPACLLMGAGIAALEGGGVVPKRWAWLATRERWLGLLLATVTLLALVRATALTIEERDSNPSLMTMRRCVLQFQQYVPPNDFIVIHGGSMVDEYGRPVAYNESMAFAWMDRKGFNYGMQELSIDTLERIAARGGRYWIVRDDELQHGNLRAVADQRYHLVARCQSGYSLYDLHAGTLR
jgi:hypothetical protein